MARCGRRKTWIVGDKCRWRPKRIWEYSCSQDSNQGMSKPKIVGNRSRTCWWRGWAQVRERNCFGNHRFDERPRVDPTSLNLLRNLIWDARSKLTTVDNHSIIIIGKLGERVLVCFSKTKRCFFLRTIYLWKWSLIQEIWFVSTSKYSC